MHDFRRGILIGCKYSFRNGHRAGFPDNFELGAKVHAAEGLGAINWAVAAMAQKEVMSGQLAWTGALLQDCGQAKS